ncbi:MAG: class I SAM-dependent methyltransferase [Cytophagales bacterium]|nr:class I SAM-dependent methyltransferase [Cytophagales bacterium]
MLTAAKEAGWNEMTGTEISTHAVKFVSEKLGFKVQQGTIENIDFGEKKFDGLVMNHVLEHVENPKITLEKIRSVMNDGAVIRFEVPNVDSISMRIKNLYCKLELIKNRNKHYATFHHFWFYKKNTLNYVLENSGFRVLEIYTPGKQWGKLNLIDKAISWFRQSTNTGKAVVAYASRIND